MPDTTETVTALSDAAETVAALPGAAETITVSSSNNTVYFDKKPYCFYCGTEQSQIQRHWQTKHGNEREVIELATLKDKTERCKRICKLRNMGNHLHNIEVLQRQEGELLVTYRSRNAASASDYVPCEFCYKYLKKSELYRHKCNFERPKGRVASKASLLLPPPPGTSVQVQEVLSGLRDGVIKVVARNDNLIVDYVAKFIARKGMKKIAYIRDKVREVTRFLLEIRKLDGMSNTNLTDVIVPEQFKLCITAVKSLAGFDVKTMTYLTPSLALKIGHALQKLAKLVKRNAIQLKDEEKVKAADYFAELCSMEWSDEIARHALGTLTDRKRNKVNLLPLSEDVCKLNTYLDLTSESVRVRMQTNEGSVEEAWRQLAEVTLTQIITFNRRRQGEVSKMTMDEYNHKTVVNMTSDAMNALSPLEQSLCRLFARVELKGKRDRTVPILLLPKVQTSIKLLLKYRSAANCS